MIIVEINNNYIKENLKSIKEFFTTNKHNYDLFHPHEFSINGIENEITNHLKDYYVFLIDNDKNIAGYGMLRGWQEGYNIPSLGIMINEKDRGKGLSKILMDHLHYIAKYKGAKNIRLTVYKKNEKAINLYKKLGYIFSNKNKLELLGIKQL